MDAKNPSDDTPPTSPEIQISMDHIFLNKIGELFDSARIWYDPNLYDYLAWDPQAVVHYYGKDLTPAYIPDGLIPAPGNGTATVIADKDGNIAADTVWLNFYHDYYEDGSPKLTEDAAACKGFSITASKIGIEYQVISDQMKIEELVKVVTSMITGSDEIAID